MDTDRNGNLLHSGDVVIVQCTVEEVYPDGWCNLRISPPGAATRFCSFPAPASAVARAGSRQGYPVTGAQPPPGEEPKPAIAAR